MVLFDKARQAFSFLFLFHLLLGKRGETVVQSMDGQCTKSSHWAAIFVVVHKVGRVGVPHFYFCYLFIIIIIIITG